MAYNCPGLPSLCTFPPKLPTLGGTIIRLRPYNHATNKVLNSHPTIPPFSNIMTLLCLLSMQVFYKMVELLVNKYKYSGDNATDALPCVRRRTRRRDSIQCAADVRSPASADSATDSTRLPAYDTHSHVPEQRTEQSRSCYCA